jgi:hypothetical protein
MGLIELIIVVLVLLWLLGYFGRGRFLSGSPRLASGNLVHTLLVIAVILILLRLLRII